MDFHSLTRRELQALCKKNGIPANITNVAMADSLKALQNTVQGTEDLSNCSQSLTAQSGVESPERSEVSSPRVPRTRSIRKKVGTETQVNQTQSRARRTTRKLNSAADEKNTIAPINIDVQFSEVQKQSKKISTSKEAGIPQTPSMVSNTRKHVSKGETTAKTYGTRRSTRLAAKVQEDTSDAANMQLFSADGGDNYEMNVKECYPDLSEDVQSTVSHSGCDSTKDCEKIVEMVILEVPEVVNEGDDFPERPEVENMDEAVGGNGDDFHEQPEVEHNNNNVIGENGDGFYEEPEIEMKDEISAENVDEVTKQPDNEIMAEVAAESYAENLVPEMKGLTLGDNGDMMVETEENVARDALADVVTVGVGEQMVNGDCVALGIDEFVSESEKEEAVVVTRAAEEQLGDCVALGIEEVVSKSESQKEEMVVTSVAEQPLDNGDSDALLGEDSESEFESKFGSESEEVVSESEEEHLSTENQLEEESESEEETESESEEEAEEEDLSTEKQLDVVPIAAEEESESEEEDLVTKLDNGDCDKSVINEVSVPMSGEDKADVTVVVKEQLVKLDCDNKSSQENSGEDETNKAQVDSQMIFLDDGIVLPATVTLTGNNKSAANIKVIDCPNVLVGKENSDEYSSVTKEDNPKNKLIDVTDLSMRQIKKQLKMLSLKNKKANSAKLDENLGTVPRPALKTLPENHQF